MSNLTPLEQLIAYVKKRYETNTSFENLVEALKEEDETILETEKERAYDQGHIDGYNEALEATIKKINIPKGDVCFKCNDVMRTAVILP